MINGCHDVVLKISAAKVLAYYHSKGKKQHCALKLVFGLLNFSNVANLPFLLFEITDVNLFLTAKLLQRHNSFPKYKRCT